MPGFLPATRARRGLTNRAVDGEHDIVANRLTRLARIGLIATVQILLVAVILALLLANWMPAIYTSAWFRKWWE